MTDVVDKLQKAIELAQEKWKNEGRLEVVRELKEWILAQPLARKGPVNAADHGFVAATYGKVLAKLDEIEGRGRSDDDDDA